MGIDLRILVTETDHDEKKQEPIAGRNRLSAEPWLGGDNRLGRLNMWGGAAWLSGLVATLALLPE